MKPIFAAILSMLGIRRDTSDEHAFTCKKCGSHVVSWNNDIFHCQSCGEPSKKVKTESP